MTTTKKTAKVTGNTMIRINSFMNVSVKEGEENTARLVRFGGDKICKNLESLHFGSGIMNNETQRKPQQNTRIN